MIDIKGINAKYDLKKTPNSTNEKNEYKSEISNPIFLLWNKKTIWETYKNVINSLDGIAIKIATIKKAEYMTIFFIVSITFIS